MRSSSALILLAILVTFSAGQVLAQDALNETGATNATNATNVTNVTNAANAANATNAANAANVTNATVVADVAPVEEAEAPLNETVQVAEAASEVVEATPQAPASRFKQLSTFVKGASTILGKNAAQEYSDVSKTVNRDTVFTRGAGAYTPSVKVGITWVNTGEDKYVQVTNKAVGSWELAGWTLASSGSATFTFPALTLEEASSVRVHEGEGAGSKSDIYTNGTAPLWIDNLVTLQNADGSIISTYDVSMASAAAKWVDPLARQIQY